MTGWVKQARNFVGLFGERAGSISRVTRRFTGHRGRPIKPEACSPDMCNDGSCQASEDMLLFSINPSISLGRASPARRDVPAAACSDGKPL
jgi:hypothetical protein